MLLTGFLVFDSDLECLDEVLGETLPVKIGGINATMAFPRLSEKSFKNIENNHEFFHPLNAPIGAEKWKQDERPLFWGSPISFPNVTVSISRIAFFIECSDNDLKSVAHDLYIDMPRWKESFINYCKLCNKIFPLRDINLRTKKCDFELYSNKKIQPENPDVISIYWIEPSDRISLSQIKKACKFASSGKDFYLEYQMILTAYNGIENCQNRPAIIDACSALEICLTRRIIDYSTNIGLDPEILLSKYRLLSDKVTLTRKFYPDFSNISGIKERVIDIRNNVAHSKTIFPTDRETNELLKKVEECLQFFYNDFYGL